MSIEAHSRLQTQSVSRSETARNGPRGLTRIEQIAPQLFRKLWIGIEFETVFARVAGARDQTFDAAHFSVGEAVVEQGVERRRSKPRQNLLRARTLQRQL